MVAQLRDDAGLSVIGVRCSYGTLVGPGMRVGLSLTSYTGIVEERYPFLRVYQVDLQDGGM